MKIFALALSNSFLKSSLSS